MYYRTITFREITTKTIRVYDDGSDSDPRVGINKEIDRLCENPDEIDFEKEPDSYEVDAVFIGNLQEE